MILPTTCDGPRKSHLFFKLPFVDTEFDMPVLTELFRWSM